MDLDRIGIQWNEQTSRYEPYAKPHGWFNFSMMMLSDAPSAGKIIAAGLKWVELISNYNPFPNGGFGSGDVSNALTQSVSIAAFPQTIRDGVRAARTNWEWCYPNPNTPEASRKTLFNVFATNCKIMSKMADFLVALSAWLACKGTVTLSDATIYRLKVVKYGGGFVGEVDLYRTQSKKWEKAKADGTQDTFAAKAAWWGSYASAANIALNVLSFLALVYATAFPVALLLAGTMLTITKITELYFTSEQADLEAATNVALVIGQLDAKQGPAPGEGAADDDGGDDDGGQAGDTSRVDQ